jgi:hypothetical protein
MRSVGFSPLDVTCRSLPVRTRLNLSMTASFNNSSQALMPLIMDSLDTDYEEVHVQLWTHERGSAEVTFNDLFLVTRRDTESSLKEAFDQDLPPGSKLNIGHAPKGTTFEEVQAKTFEPKKAGRVTIAQVFQQIQHFFDTQLPTMFVSSGNIVILIAEMPHVANNVDAGNGAIVPYNGTPAAASVAPSGRKPRKGRGARQQWHTLSRDYMVKTWPRHPEDQPEAGIFKGMYYLITDDECTAILLYTPLWISASLHYDFLISTPLWISASLVWEGQGRGGGWGCCCTSADATTVV